LIEGREKKREEQRKNWKGFVVRVLKLKEMIAGMKGVWEFLTGRVLCRLRELFSLKITFGIQ
jgi:hypothetical protein